ncbi:ABC transporter permease [Burkholderia ubonensis]|uniref:ABC transporter permease n=1 Tax=Burkholderia ubonensis TaxID=101571 RepID=UPI000F58B3C3|nr:ABC transporter permease [Burkholderia ubonensis]RQP27728.1 ABC transporter permease [Burkholderia ubonensis]RQP29744.1 ABC transporter permease [Burkholderia ubonensis]RQP31900.1 ABC transporter permease [Burkholderia ubonensis]RQP47843.1 ABC transporter permease [Burkholderia ubonensis]RQP50860.1 ABC transporter permease [Burkholderia ubonensis]
MMLGSLAFRNILRNRRRSAITVAAIAIGLAAMTFLWGFTDGMNREMIENTTRYFAGDAQVHATGYHDDPVLDRAMPDAAPLLKAVRNEPAVAAASLRLEARALATHGDRSRGVMIVGVVPRDEAKVTILSEAIIAGRGLAEAEPGVLIGEKLAQALELRPGQNVAFVGQAYDGSISSGQYPVRGVFRSKINELDGYVAVMPLNVVRDFLSAPSGATAIALRLRDRATLDKSRAALQAHLGSGYEVVGWPRLLPMVAVSSRFHEVVTYVVLLVFFVVVIAAVANPVLVSVMERTREFGIMLAVGMSRTRLLRLVLYETILLGAAGLVVGNAIGWLVTGYFSRAGIHLHAFEAGLRTMPGLSDVVYPVLSIERGIVLSVAVFVIAGLAALYPAAKAVRLQPVDAIHGLTGTMRTPRQHGVDLPLPVFVRIALCNLMRNPRRTAIMVAGTAFGIVGFAFILSFFDGFFDQTIENSTRYLTGHLQVERAGFRDDYAPQLSIDRVAPLLDALRRTPGVVAAAPRVQTQALASTAAKSEGIMLVGIDPLAEARVTFIARTIVQGHALAPGADREVMIGRRLADKLRVRLGEKIVVMTQAASGELGTAAYRVGGVFSTESASFDEAFAFVTLSAAQSLLGLGGRVSTINLRFENRERVPSMIPVLRSQADASGIALVPWQTLLPQLDDMVKLLRIVNAIVLSVLLLVITSAVINTVFMAVTERTREFGVMLALGTSPGELASMVVYETAAMLLLSAAAGYGIGAALVIYLGHTGIDMSGFFSGYSAIPGLTGIVYPRMMSATVIPPGIALVTAGVLVSLYPAAKAARLDPVEAIRHV